MANELERPIEKLLRAAAQKRRDDAGAPFKLHPADRRLLQSEVARTFAQPQRAHAAPSPRPFPSSGPASPVPSRCLPCSVWRSGRFCPFRATTNRKLSLARNLPASKDMLAQEPQPSATPAPAPSVLPLAPEAKKEPQLLAFADKQKSATATPPAQLTETPSPVAAANAVALRNSFDAPKLELATAPQLAVREEAAKPLVVAADGMPPPAPAGVAGGALAQRYGLAVQPGSTPSPPVSRAAPATVALAPAAAGVPLADESANLAGTLSRQTAAAPAAQPERIHTTRNRQIRPATRALQISARRRLGQPPHSLSHPHGQPVPSRPRGLAAGQGLDRRPAFRASPVRDERQGRTRSHRRGHPCRVGLLSSRAGRPGAADYRW